MMDHKRFPFRFGATNSSGFAATCGMAYPWHIL